jgi:sialic acid synthase SpsE
MANLNEIEEAVDCAKQAGCQDLILLHCISSYPAPVDHSNLLTIPDLAKRFNVLSGLSDHTLGTAVAVTSVALGACFIEKHFTLSRDDEGPDSSFSMEPGEFKSLCKDTKIAWQSLGRAGYDFKESEKANVQFRRSLYFVNNLNKGHKITSQDIRSVRPGFGLPPKYFDRIVGKIVTKDVKFGEPTSLGNIDIE